MSAAGKFASHDPRVVSVFEIVSAYFCDTYYNHVHHSAKTNLTSGASLTDEYVRRIQAYVIGVKNDGRCYSDVVQGVHTYFTGTTRFTTLSFAEFVNRIVGVCVPEEYFRQFSPQDKDEMLSSVLCDLVSNLAAFATKPDMLRRIIDGHGTTPEVTIRMLQDAAVNALITKRAALHNKFLRKQGQARDTVSMDIVDDMKKALRRLVKEKAEVAARAEASEAAQDALRRQIRDAKQREAKLLKLVELLRRGRDEGPAKVGAELCVPRRDTLAEAEVSAGRNAPPPRRERIAERRDEDDEDDEEDDDEDDDEDNDEDDGSARGRSRRNASRPAIARPTVTANFFKTDALAGIAGGVTAAQLRTGVRPGGGLRPAATAATAATSAGADPGRAGAPPPGPLLMASLLDNVVDTTGNSALDEILYGTG
jgi:hypothetical protein